MIEALRQVPRSLFVHPRFMGRAYEDVPLPIPHGQVTTQPSLVAKMIEVLDPSKTKRVLEVGTGFGFQTALLAHLVKHVWSVERWADMAETARANLDRLGVRNVTVVVGDGSKGLPDEAPFDAILVSAAHPEVPQPLADQLVPGGKLVQPIGWGGGEQVTLFEKEQDRLVRVREVTGAHFVRLYGRFGFHNED